MSDQAFVKAFSRRRPASDQTTQSGGSEAGDTGSGIQEQAASRVTSATRASQMLGQQVSDSASDGDASGGLQLDQSVAATARVWIDHHADRLSRADYAGDEIPRPYLEALTGDQTPPFESSDSANNMQGFRPDAEPVGPLRSEQHAAVADERDSLAQPIQDAYASTFTDAAGFVNDQLSNVEPAEVLRTLREADAGSLDSSFSLKNDLSTHQPKFESIAHSELLQSDAETSELIIENPFANAAKHEHETQPASPTFGCDSISDSHVPQQDAYQPAGTDEYVLDSTPNDSGHVGAQVGLKPFQAVWEVDVLDVPTIVADLFFEGRLFQQIAERMSDAVDSGLNSVIVTSAQSGEGRSSVAIGLAMTAAAAGKRVALVDANLEQPKLADELRLELQHGWIDTIRAGLPMKEVAVHAVEDGVTLIPLKPTKQNIAATGDELVQLVDLLEDKFDLLILDGPTSQSSQIDQCASAVDSAIIVRDTARTDAFAINDFSCRLRKSGIKGVGVVENFT
ncbi:MAG: hypothetical protein CMM01_09985 [Rhodopirellula sp.]|nr:hypothetical protein [Rhodopirellula sp.]OUX51338.1 MAG: hypothetical protein CBE43_03625 [Rhodopirellula sp. TMED283]